MGGFRAAALCPVYLALGWIHGGPGIGVHLRIAKLALSLAPLKTPLPNRFAQNLALAPLGSVRYFEFAFFMDRLREVGSVQRYLDVSSPRMLPILVLKTFRSATAELINPDSRDLALTSRLLQAFGLSRRTRLHPVAAGAAPFVSESFDLITCLSVLEHIPAPGDGEALTLLWRLLRPGGQLLVSVPCAVNAFEEFLDFNEYGLLPPDENGFTFGQRFYDEDLLQSTFFERLGRPRRAAVFGEKTAGTFFEARSEEQRGEGKFWREPYAVATDYRLFESVRDLPGVGVIAMEFVKAE